MHIYISGVWNVEVWSGHAQLLRTIHLIVLLEYITGMKLAGITELLSLYQSSKFYILMFFLLCFMNL